MPLRQLLLLVAVATAPSVSGCGRAEPARAEPAGRVDSVVPRDVALARFRHDLPPVETLAGGATTRDGLVRAFVRALERRDSTALQRLAMDRAEFAWLYYGTNPQGLPPYDLSPALLWFVLEGRGRQGLAQALAERGGQPLHVVGYACEPEPSREGVNRVWGPCHIRRVQAPGDTVSERLFGPILERGGRFKFVNLANRL